MERKVFSRGIKLRERVAEKEGSGSRRGGGAMRGEVVRAVGMVARPGVNGQAAPGRSAGASAG